MNTSLRAVREVPQDAHAVLDALVVDVGLLDGLAHEGDERVDEALALAQLLAAVVAGRAHVPENRGGRKCSTLCV